LSIEALLNHTFLHGHKTTTCNHTADNLTDCKSISSMTKPHKMVTEVGKNEKIK